MTVIRIECLADGRSTPFDGQFVADFDPERDMTLPDGAELNFYLRTTPDRTQALELPSGDALRLWRQISKRDPVRPDGGANRPLTAFTVSFV